MTLKFVSTKSKVVSNKGLSIPRIELLSCLLLSKLVSTVVNAISVEVVVNKTVCWADLLVALWWIKRADKIWKVWVEKWVRKIREKVGSSSWKHISGELNPADIATRECRPKVLPQLWFYGPEFLKSPKMKSGPYLKQYQLAYHLKLVLKNWELNWLLMPCLWRSQMSLILGRLLIVSVLVIWKNCWLC